IGDFGLAHLLGDKLSTVMGTVRYMPPEACGEKDDSIVDQRADIYSLGLMIYELALGTARFDEIMKQQPGWTSSMAGWVVWQCNRNARLPRLDQVRPDVPA